MEEMHTRQLFLRSMVCTAGLPLVALPFWIADVNVGAWSGSLGLYEVLVAPLLLVLVAFRFYRRTRWFRVRWYMAAMGGAALLGVGLWYLGLGINKQILFRPDWLTLELVGIALGAQCMAAYGAVMVIAGMRRMQAAE